MPQAVFVDTWGWVALGHRRDARHPEVQTFYELCRRQGTGIITSDFVVDELVTLLFRREVFSEAVQFIDGLLAAASAGHLQIERIGPERFSEAWQLRRKYQDKPRISFTDLTSMVVMRDLGITSILTDDEHFLQVGMGFSLVPEGTSP